jgi:hypothetical protein
MSFTPDEKGRVEFLTWKANFGGGLTPWEQEELRTLLSRESPLAQNFDANQLVGLALLLLAGWALWKMSKR